MAHRIKPVVSTVQPWHGLASFDSPPVRPIDTNTLWNALRVQRLDTGEVLGIISDRYVPVPIEHVERVAAMQADERETERSAFVCSCCRIAEPLVDSYCEPCYEGECDRPLFTGGTCAEARLAAEVAAVNESYERRFGGAR